ncbi:hypothetical protein M758_7G092600 [Ceratodon purpureus]|nr:hypothetical protein M758_7G092600 [Ceratodon purpureus]
MVRSTSTACHQCHGHWESNNTTGLHLRRSRNRNPDNEAPSAIFSRTRSQFDSDSPSILKLRLSTRTSQIYVKLKSCNRDVIIRKISCALFSKNKGPKYRRKKADTVQERRTFKRHILISTLDSKIKMNEII